MKRLSPAASWSEEMLHVYHHDLVQWWDPQPMPHSYNAYHAFIELVSGMIQRLQARRVLDIGCAQATLDLLLAERGLEVTAVEIRPGFLEYAKSRQESGNVRWVLGNFFEIAVPGTPYDLAMSHHVIEHITEPLAFLRRLADCIKPGGHVLVTTPNYHYVRSQLPSYRAVGDLRTYPDFANSRDGDDHVFAFTREELCRLGEEAGLRLEQHFYYESFLLAGHMKLRHLHRVLPAAAVRSLEPLAAVPGCGAFYHAQGVLLRKP